MTVPPGSATAGGAEAPATATAPQSGPRAATPPTGAGRAGLLGGLLLAVLSVALYLPSLGYHLVFDDVFLISPERNASMRGLDESLAPAWRLFAQEYWEGVNPDRLEGVRSRGQALYRPLTLAVWAVIQHTWGWQTYTQGWPYHLVNVLVNAWVVVMLYQLVRRLFGGVRLAFVTALVFAVHPLHSEAVAYVAGLSDLLAAATVLLGLHCWLSATEGGRLRAGAYGALLVTLFVGLLAKESAVLLLAAVALTDVMLTLRRQGRGQRLFVYGGLLLVVAAHVALRYAVMGYLKPDTSSIGRLDNVLIAEPFDVRALNAFKLLAKYVWLVLWPAEQSVDYSFAAITVSRSWTAAVPLAGVVLVATIVLVGLLKLRSSPAFGWGLLFFVGTAIYTSNMLVPIGTIFGERLMYLPTIGAALALAAVLDRLLAPSGKPGAAANPVGLLVVVVASGALALRTWDRNHDFRTSLALFESALEVVPESAKVHYQLGSLYASERLFDKAAERYEEALVHEPTFVQAAIQLGDTHAAQQVWDKAEKIYTDILDGLDRGQSGITSDPGQAASVRALVYEKRALARRQLGQVEGAASDLRLAGQHVPSAPGPAKGLARLLQDQEKWAESIPPLRQALSGMQAAGVPLDVELLMMLARAAAAVGDEETYEEALSGLEATEEGRHYALAMRGETLYGRAITEQDAGLREDALELLDQAIRLAPDALAGPYYFRGRYLVETARAFHDALLQYDRALEIDGRFAPALLYKSLAQMALGRHAEALATLKILETVAPTAAVYTLQGECHFMAGDVEAMEKAYAKVRALGTEPVAAIIQRAQALQAGGLLEEALDVIEQALVSAEFAGDADPWKLKGLLLLELGRTEEALASFDRQKQVLAADPEQPRDPFVDSNRARCLAALGRHVEADLALVEMEGGMVDLVVGTELWRKTRVSLLRRRAELQLDRAGPFFDPAAAEAAAAEGIELSNARHPALFELSIEARLLQEDLPAATARAEQAAGTSALRRMPQFPLAAEALRLAADGDLAAAVARLRSGSAGNAFLQRLAERLQG